MGEPEVDTEALALLAEGVAASMNTGATEAPPGEALGATRTRIPAPVKAYNASATYNTLVGSTMIGYTYRFTSDPIPLEGAKRMAAAGARVHKFSLSTYLDKKRSKSIRTGSLLEAATHPTMGYKDIFELPFSRFVFWAYAANETNVYGEFYDLAAHLITKYQGTGKSFYIGHWEGDWSIRHNYQDPIDPSRAQWFRRSLSDMMRAIDTAKIHYADLVGGESGVKIWGYAEVNRVLTSMRDPTYKSFVNQVLPYINPPVDFVSYSNWEIEEAKERSADELGQVLHDALDFMSCHLPPKPCVPEPRAFVGEFGYFLKDKRCNPMMAPPVKSGSGPARPTTPEIVKQRSMWHMAQAVAWGSPMTLFWELYSNEAGLDDVGDRCDRGYWLVDDTGEDAPVFTAFQDYYAAADKYIEERFREGGGAPPDNNEFRRWAVAKLGELAGYGGEVPLPAVRVVDPQKAAAGGGH